MGFIRSISYEGRTWGLSGPSHVAIGHGFIRSISCGDRTWSLSGPSHMKVGLGDLVGLVWGLRGMLVGHGFVSQQNIRA